MPHGHALKRYRKSQSPSLMNSGLDEPHQTRRMLNVTIRRTVGVDSRRYLLGSPKAFQYASRERDGSLGLLRILAQIRAVKQERLLISGSARVWVNSRSRPVSVIVRCKRLPAGRPFESATGHWSLSYK